MRQIYKKLTIRIYDTNLLVAPFGSYFKGNSFIKTAKKCESYLQSFCIKTEYNSLIFYEKILLYEK